MKKIIEKENIRNMIHEVRGKQVMLDSDLAKLYHVEKKKINDKVRKNIEKFPERFSWILTDEELLLLSKLQIVENNNSKLKTNPRVFTEQGVEMLASLLTSNEEIKVSIAIMDTFVEMQYYTKNDLLDQKYYNSMVIKHDIEIKQLQELINQIQKTN